MWESITRWYKYRKANVNTHREDTADRKRWLGLELLTLRAVPRSNGLQAVITARIVEKMQDYTGKFLHFDRKKWRVTGVERGRCKHLVGLYVECFGPL